uniref:Uncharacterized protein n=1 Tax=Fagus sylvatica TaxID=28930 RepID=A0A2N9FLB7_FAGSY
MHGFKNRTGPAGSTGSTANRCSVRLPSSVLTPPLPFSLCLSVSHSHVLTSGSHGLTLASHGLTSGILVSISHSRGFSPHCLTSGAISPPRLTVSIFHRLTLVARDLTVASRLRSHRHRLSSISLTH